MAYYYEVVEDHNLGVHRSGLFDTSDGALMAGLAFRLRQYPDAADLLEALDDPEAIEDFEEAIAVRDWQAAMDLLPEWPRVSVQHEGSPEVQDDLKADTELQQELTRLDMP